MSQGLAPATGAVQRWLETLAHHAKSFNFASRVLPRSCRAEAAALYAWCRAADDAIDLAPRESCGENLARLARDLDDVYAGRPQRDLVLTAFQEVVNARQVPRDYPAELLAGLAMDIEKDRYATLDELLQYCFRVAGTVGLSTRCAHGKARLCGDRWPHRRPWLRRNGWPGGRSARSQACLPSTATK
jgi:phytoene/squalene synthetase